MNENSIEIPKVKSVDSQFFIDELPEIINIDYDLWILRITLSFAEINKPVAYVAFKNVVGFRLLDEGNLLEFWNPNVKVRGWIWEIENGGWFDLEKHRSGFVEAHREHDKRKEYLISGITDCINIIAYSQPEFIDPE